MEKKMGVWLCCIAVLLAVIWGIGYAEDIIHKGSRVKHSEAGSSQSMLSGSSVTLASTPWSYKVTGPNNSNLVAVNKLNEVVYFELDATVPNYVWGNIVVLYDKTKLNAVSLEENPDNWYGFWTWWTYATGQSVYGGGGNYYYYDYVAGTSVANQGSQWAQDWVNIYGGGGPVGTIDPNYGSALDLNSADYQALINKGISNISNLGAIRLYTSTYAGGQYGASPLRVGFEVISTSDAVFDVFANDSTSYNFHPAQLDSYLRSTVTLVLQDYDIHFDSKIKYDSTASITAPRKVDANKSYTVNLDAVTPAPIYQWSLYENGVLIDSQGFAWGSQFSKIFTFNKTVAGEYVYLFAFRGIGGAHGWTPFIEVSLTSTVSAPDALAALKGKSNQYQNAVGSQEQNDKDKDIDNARKDAEKKIDDAAKTAKKAIDDNKNLTKEEKKEKKDKIDTIAKDAKNTLDTYGKYQSAIDVITQWAIDRINQVRDGTDVCAEGWSCDLSMPGIPAPNPETGVSEVPRSLWHIGYIGPIHMETSSPKDTTPVPEIYTTDSSGGKFSYKQIKDLEDVENLERSNTFIGDTTQGPESTMIYLKLKVYEEKFWILPDILRCEKKYLWHLGP